jgi:hypothetical protein
MKKYASIAALLSLSVLAGCGQDALQVLTAAPFTASRVRFYNFGVNDPGVNFYTDTSKATSITNTAGIDSSTGTAYGSIAPNNGDYIEITSGSHTLAAKLAADVTHPTIASVVATIADGHFYSFYTSGFYNTTTKAVDSFVVEDPFVVPADTSTISVRFVNAISNSSPMILYAKNETSLVETAIGGAAAYKSAGAFTSLPPGIYDLNTRLAGSSTNLITRLAVSFIGGHAYTISGRGDMTVVSTTATNRPFLDNTANY